MLLSYSDIAAHSKLLSKELNYGSRPSCDQAAYLDSLFSSFSSARNKKRVIVITESDEDSPAGKFVSVDTSLFTDVDSGYDGGWGAIVASNDIGEPDNIMRYTAASYIGGMIPDGITKFAVLVSGPKQIPLMSFLPELVSYGIYLVNAFGMPGSRLLYDPLHEEGVAVGTDRTTRAGNDIVLLKCHPDRVGGFTSIQRKAAMLNAFAKQWVRARTITKKTGTLFTQEMLEVCVKAVSFYSQGLLSLPQGLEQCCGKLPYPLSFCTLPPMTEEEQVLEEILNKSTVLQEGLSVMFELSGFGIGGITACDEFPDFPRTRNISDALPMSVIGDFCRKPLSDETISEFLVSARRPYFEAKDIVRRFVSKTPQSSGVPSEVSRLFPPQRQSGARRCKSEQTAALSDLIDIVFGPTTPPPGRGVNTYMFVLMVNSGYDAIVDHIAPGRWGVQEAEGESPDSDWGLMFASGTMAIPNVGLCALACGLVPENVGKVLIVGSDWAQMPLERIDDIKSAISKSSEKGVVMIADESGSGLWEGGACGLENKMRIQQKMVRNAQGGRIVHLASPDLAIPHIRESLVPAMEYARQYDAAMMVNESIGNGRVLFSDDMLDFLSMGKSKTSGCAEVNARPGFNGENIRSKLPMLDIVYPPSRSGVPDWAAPAVEFADLCQIWRYAAQLGGMSLRLSFPEGVSKSACYKMAGKLGVESMLDAYYAGVPIEDVVEKG